MYQINFITGNTGKLAEVQALLKDSTIKLQNIAIDVPEIQGAIDEIARTKCQHAAKLVNGPTLTEDTALEFNSLKGLPGPYIKWFLKSLGHEGLNDILEHYSDKSATAICTFAFTQGPESEPILFQGRTEGRIVPPRGSKNFGWDAVFEVDGKTFGEMNKEEKVCNWPLSSDQISCFSGLPECQNQVSHRCKALSKMKQWFVDNDVCITDSNG